MRDPDPAAGPLVGDDHSKELTQGETTGQTFAGLVVQIVSGFVDLDPSEVDQVVLRALHHIGRYAGVDRAYVFLLDERRRLAYNTHEWCAEMIEPQAHRLQGIVLDEMLPWFAERIRRLETFQVPRVAALPEAAGAEREEFETEGIQSLVCVPMSQRGELVGFLGFDAVRAEKTWSESDVALLTILGSVVTRALDRRRVEEALHQSEARFRGLVESINDWVWELNEHAAFTYCSPQCEDILGYAPGEIVGHTPCDSMSPEEAQRVDIALSPVVAARRRVVNFEYLARHRDGREVPVEISAVPIVDASGVYRGYRGINRDVTERKRAEARLQAMWQNLSDAVVLLDENAVFRYASPSAARVLGHAPEALLGRSAFELIHPEDMGVATDGFGQVRSATNPGIPTEFRLCRADGTYVLLESVGANLLAHPAVRGLVFTARDVTERKRVEEERRGWEAKVQQTQKLESLGILAGGVAHDFSNLLTGILGHVGLALSQVPSGSPAWESICLMERAARRAAELTQQMLAFSGAGRFVVERVRLSEVADETANLLAVSIPQRCAVSRRFAQDLPLVEADVGQLRQVAMNLIVNAAEALGDGGGEIWLSTGVWDGGRGGLSQSFLDGDLAEGPHVYLEVKDDGMGMTADVKSRMFEPFFSTKFAGRGLGLAAVLGIVRSHHGAIAVASEPGCGTAVRILFPVAACEVQPPAAVPGEAGSVRQGRTVLVVDDEEIVRTVASHFLERQGYSVLTARSGREAVELLRTQGENVCVVLLDLTMPDLDGEKTFHEVRCLRGDLPVILCSGYGEKEVLRRFGDQKLAGFIQKPYSADELSQAMDRALGRTPEISREQTPGRR
jgi:PAS domain S-box-containing protein